MAYYPDDERTEAVVRYLRESADRGETIYQREVHTALGMNKNCVWKVIQSLVDDGRADRIPTDYGPAGHKRLIIALREWELLTDEQRERMISILERIAASQEAILRQGTGPVYNIGTATINNNPAPEPEVPIYIRGRMEIPEERMRTMETKGNSLESDNSE